MIRRTAGLLVASLVLALSATPLTPSVRAVGATTWIVAHHDEILDYADGSTCADPDFSTDGSWSESGSGDGAYDSDEDAIQDAIDNAASGDTIYVCFGRYEFDTDLHNIEPGMNLTIVGGGIGETVLDGTDSTRLINSNAVGEDDDGGTITLQDLSIEDARVGAFDNGGAVNADGLTLIRISITGSDNAYNGGALYAEGDVSIVDSTFTDNSTSEDGAVLYAWNAARTVSISDSVFDGNAAGRVGGAIVATTVTVTGSTFTSNRATSDEGGAIVATTVTVTGSTFSGNESGCVGGAISADSATVASSKFTGNLSGCEGGAIYADADVNVTLTVFTSNVADDYGGAIDVYGDLVVRGSTFRSNESGDGGAIAVWGPTATVIGSTFTNNKAIAAFGYGGAVVANSILVNRSAFTNNSAYEGGAIRAGTDATVTRSTFASNDASSNGGAVDAYTGTIARSRFTRNSAGEHGGAVILNSANSDDLQQLRGNTFMRNTAPVGGAITLGPCNAPSRSEVARVERANRFSGNRSTEQRRTNNIERWENGCG